MHYVRGRLFFTQPSLYECDSTIDRKKKQKEDDLISKQENINRDASKVTNICTEGHVISSQILRQLICDKHMSLFLFVSF